MQRLSVSFCLVLLLALVGCRESLVDVSEPGAPVGEPAPPASSGLAKAYFKGPEQVHVGTSASFRIEPLHEAARYAWHIPDSDRGLIEGTLSRDYSGLQRSLNITAVREGTLDMTVTVYDAQDQAIARASKHVEIVY